MAFPILCAAVGATLLPAGKDWEALPIPTICAEVVPRDDPPALIVNEGPDAPPTDAEFDPLHHPLHALALQGAGNAETVVGAPALDVEADVTALDFLLARLR